MNFNSSRGDVINFNCLMKMPLMVRSSHTSSSRGEDHLTLHELEDHLTALTHLYLLEQCILLPVNRTL